MIPYMEKQIQKAGKEIRQKKLRDYPKMSTITRRRFDKTMGPFLALESEYDKGFYADERCIGCGICKKVCPTRNITMEDKGPKWNHHCHGCNACVAYCPTKAVQYKVPQVYKELDSIICKLLCLPERRKRYHHPQIEAKDLMSDRKEIKPDYNL